MAIFTLKQKIFIVKRYYQCGNSMQIVQNEYPKEFYDSDDDKPTDENIIELINLFEEFGSVLMYRTKSKDIYLADAGEFTVTSCEIKQDISSNEESFSKTEIKTEFEEQGIDDVPEIIGSIEATISSDDLNENIGIGEPSNTYIIVEQRKNSNISCGQCDNQCKTKSTYSDNLRINEKECKNSNKSSNNKVGDLKLHTINYSLDPLYCGTENDFDFKKEEHLEEYVSVLSDKNIYSCKTCEKPFKTRIRLTAHERCHLTDKSTNSDKLRINDKECKNSKNNNKISDLILHTTQYALDPLYCDTKNDFPLQKEGHLEEHVSELSEKNIYSCKTCEKSFKTRIRLKAHERCHLTDKERPLKCEVCGKGFIQSYALKIHVRTHTGEKNPVVCICDICGLRLSSNRALKYHMRIHTGEKPHECPFCDKKFRQAFNLILHKRTHTGEKPFICNICGKSMTNKRSLKNHIETIHERARPYPCTFCDKKFTTPLSLNIHKRSHTGERPFICGICGKSFITNHLLKHHKTVIHDGEKPYQCNICNNKYAAYKTLQTHKRIHTGERPYACQYCSKAFYDSGTLRKHIRTHTGEKPFKCTICKKLFSQRGNLRTHMKNVHKQEL